MKAFIFCNISFNNCSSLRVLTTRALRLSLTSPLMPSLLCSLFASKRPITTAVVVPPWLAIWSWPWLTQKRLQHTLHKLEHTNGSCHPQHVQFRCKVSMQLQLSTRLACTIVDVDNIPLPQVHRELVAIESLFIFFTLNGVLNCSLMGKYM